MILIHNSGSRQIPHGLKYIFDLSNFSLQLLIFRLCRGTQLQQYIATLPNYNVVKWANFTVRGCLYVITLEL